MLSAPTQGSSKKRHSGRSEVRHNIADQSVGGVPATPAVNSRDFPEPSAHAPSSPEHVEIEVDDEDPEIVVISPLRRSFNYSAPHLPDDGDERSGPQCRATAPTPPTYSPPLRVPARSVTMLAHSQLPSRRLAQQPSTLGTGTSESSDTAMNILSTMPSPASACFPRAPPHTSVYSGYVSQPILEEPASYRSKSRPMVMPYANTRSSGDGFSGFPDPMHPDTLLSLSKPAFSADSAAMTQPQGARPGYGPLSMLRALVGGSESKRPPPVTSSLPPARSSHASPIPIVPTSSSTIGAFSDEDGMSWVMNADQDPPHRGETLHDRPTSSTASVAAGVPSSSVSKPLKASASSVSPLSRPANKLRKANSSTYSTTRAGSRSQFHRPGQASSCAAVSQAGQLYSNLSTSTPPRTALKSQPTPGFASKDRSTPMFAKDSAAPSRPPLNPTGDSGHLNTEYTHMLLALDAVPFLFNLAANTATWLLLAGFIVLPGTFSGLSELTIQSSTVEATVVHAVQNIPLFIVAYVLSGVGAIGMCWLWWRWSRNYIWILENIFIPGMFNGLAGVFSTLATVLGTQNGVFTASAITTLTVTGATAAICGILAGFYTFFMLARIKNQHEREAGKSVAGKRGEGYFKAAKEFMRTKSLQ